MAGRRYLLTGGGTGGHVTPALAIADELRANDEGAEFLYVGVRGKAEEALVPRAGYRLKFVSSCGYPGAGNPLRLLWFLLVLGLGVLRALLILLGFRPSVIIATGGYVAAPVLFAATALRKTGLLRCTVFLHEQNVTPGRLNALGARFADRVGVSFAETLRALPPGKGVYVGYPVRAAATGGERAEARAALDLPGDARVVFAFGGSQGARTINRAVVAALPRLLADERVRVIHGTGRHLKGAAYDGAADAQAHLEALGTVEGLERYTRQDFFHDIGNYYAAADLVICRAGAGTLTEVCAQGLPAVVIPKANLPGDHQVGNARVLERHGAARVLYEGVDLSDEGAVESVSGEALAGMVLELLDDPTELTRMARAARQVYDPGTLPRIRQLIAHLAGDGEAPELPAPGPQPADRVLGLGSNALDQLLRRLAAGREPPLGAGEERLVRYKIDGYLAAQGDYVERARGCRMVGLAGYRERLPVLARFAAGRRADGGYCEVPIVRRDALVGLGGLGEASPPAVEALASGLQDPYFEARAAAAGSVAALARAVDDHAALASLRDGLLACLRDRAFEPRAAAARALGELDEDADAALTSLRRLYFDKVWMVRRAVFDALARLVDRQVLAAARARAEMGRVLITSTGYVTEYPLKEAYNRLRQTVEQRDGEGEG